MTTSPASPAQLPFRIGRYEALEQLGQGGMGAVYLARQRGEAGVEKLCVLKTLRPDMDTDAEYERRFLDEARVVVLLAHKNICPVFEVGRVGAELFLSMEYVAGVDCAALQQACVQANRSVPAAMVLYIAGEVLEALGAAHAAEDPRTMQQLGIVHRDVSPHNVLVSFQGEVKLIDFGLATSGLKRERTAPNVVMGKLAYMSPEQARGEDVGPGADLFAVGVMLYELWSGRRFYGDLPPRQIWSVVGQGGFRPDRWETLPPPIQRLLDRALAARAEDRFPSAAAFLADLDQARLELGLAARALHLQSLVEEHFGAERERRKVRLLKYLSEDAALDRSGRAAAATTSDATVIGHAVVDVIATATEVDNAPIEGPSTLTSSDKIRSQLDAAFASPDPSALDDDGEDETTTIVTRGPAPSVSAANTATKVVRAPVPDAPPARRSPLLVAAGAGAIGLALVATWLAWPRPTTDEGTAAPLVGSVTPGEPPAPDELSDGAPTDPPSAPEPADATPDHANTADSAAPPTASPAPSPPTDPVQAQPDDAPIPGDGASDAADDDEREHAPPKAPADTTADEADTPRTSTRAGSTRSRRRTRAPRRRAATTAPATPSPAERARAQPLPSNSVQRMVFLKKFCAHLPCGSRLPDAFATARNDPKRSAFEGWERSARKCVRACRR